MLTAGGFLVKNKVIQKYHLSPFTFYELYTYNFKKMFYLVKAPYLLKKMYPACIWNFKTDKKEIYLTFDDGPTPEVTWFVLGELKKYNALSTFFCIGKNVKDNPSLYKEIITQGHRTGNHTFNHLNGWRTNDNIYIENISLAKEVIHARLFRPPYGKITNFQIKILQGQKFGMKIIMWSVLSGDFDQKLTGEKCYKNVVKNAGPGSIIVFHDSRNAYSRLRYALPRVLEYYSDLGYQFKTIPG